MEEFISSPCTEEFAINPYTEMLAHSPHTEEFATSSYTEEFATSPHTEMLAHSPYTEELAISPYQEEFAISPSTEATGKKARRREGRWEEDVLPRSYGNVRHLGNSSPGPGYHGSHGQLLGQTSCHCAWDRVEGHMFGLI